jgi:hypothetical protein
VSGEHKLLFCSLLNLIVSACREATVYDPSVRKCLQLCPDQFQLSNPQWDAQIRRLAGEEIRRDLGLPENVTVVPELYKLLLYEVGCFFSPHRDTEKTEGMFATLVVVLPSAHLGGKNCLQA